MQNLTSLTVANGTVVTMATDGAMVASGAPRDAAAGGGVLPALPDFSVTNGDGSVTRVSPGVVDVMFHWVDAALVCGGGAALQVLRSIVDEKLAVVAATEASGGGQDGYQLSVGPQPKQRRAAAKPRGGGATQRRIPRTSVEAITSSSGRRRGPTCTKCGEPGHTRRSCPSTVRAIGDSDE